MLTAVSPENALDRSMGTLNSQTLNSLRLTVATA